MNPATDAVRSAPVTARWSRRALVGLWVLLFAIAGSALALRWDAFVSRLARPPVAVEVDGGLVP